MPAHNYIQQAGQLANEEHKHEAGEQPRKAVGLFAKDALGSGTFELSAISGPTGIQLQTNASSTGGGGTSTVFVANAVGNVTLNPSPNFIGIVTVANPTSSSGMVTIFPGPNQIGSMTVSNMPDTDPTNTFVDVRKGVLAMGRTKLSGASSLSKAVLIDDAGALMLGGSTNFIGIVTIANPTSTSGMVTIFPGPNQIGSVTVSNTVPVTGTFWQATQPVSFGLVSLASGTEIRSLVTQLNQPALIASSAYIGLASVNIGGTLPALNAGTAQIGSVTVSNFTAPNTGNVTINPGPNFIGLTTTYQGRSATTVVTTTISASGYSTVFVPPNGQRWYAHSVMVNSMGQANGFIGSASLPVITFPGLATYGGFVFPSEVPGTPAININESFTVRQFSLVTIGVTATVHFE